MSWELRRHGPGVLVFLLAVPLLLVTGSAWPQQLDERELDTTATRAFHFQRYEGRPPIVQSVEQIEGIGEVLSRGLRAGLRGTYFGKYSVIRAWKSSDTTLLGADIIVFGPRAGIDDVRNVQRIVAGYLAAAFGYPRERAGELAVRVTTYNAAHRGNLAALSARYTPLVMSYLSAENAGLAADYREWPGRTRLIVPLAGAAGASGGTVPGGQPARRQGGPAGSTPPGTGSTQQAPGPGGPGAASPGQSAGLPPSTPAPAARPSAAPGPAAAGPVATGPAATGPAATGPAATGPAAPGSSAPATPGPRGAGRGRFSINVFWLLALGAVLLLGLVVWLIVRLITRLPSYYQEVRRSVKEGHPLVEMVVIPQSRRIGHRNVHYLKPGATATVGAGRSRFLIFFVPVPRRMARLEYDGRSYTFVPLKRELFPDVEGAAVPDCLGKSIPGRSLRGYRFAIIFRKFIPPLEEINRLMRSVLPRPAAGPPPSRGGRS
jgi:hypothetical protein